MFLDRGPENEWGNVEMRRDTVRTCTWYLDRNVVCVYVVSTLGGKATV